MAHVMERRAPVRVRIVGVLPVRRFGSTDDPLWTGATKDAVEAAVVGRHLSKGVRRQELHAVIEPLPHARLHRVVFAPATRCSRRDRGDQRLYREERTTSVSRRPGRRIADTRQCLVAFDRRHQVRGMMPDVSDLRRHAARSADTRRSRSTVA